MNKLLRYSLILIFVIASQLVYSQEFEWSNLERFRNRKSYNHILGQNSSGIFVLRSRGQEIYSKVILERYRNSLGLDYSKRLVGMKGFRFIDAHVQEEGLLVWKSMFNPANEKLELFVQRVDNDNSLDGELKLMTQVGLKNFSDEGDFSIHTNKRQSHYVNCFTERIKGKYRKFHIQVWDDSLNLVREKQFVLPFEEDDFNLESVEVDTMGHAFLLFSGVNEEKERETPERIGLHVFALTNSDSLIHHYLNLSDTYLSSPLMTIDEVNKHIQVSALYSLKSRDNSKGVLFASFDLATGKKLKHEFIPYTYSFAKDIIGEDGIKRDDEPENFSLKFIVPRSDGGFILFGEEFSVAQQSYTYYVNGIAQMTSRSVYNYGKLFIISIDANAKLDWFHIVNKGQSSVNDLGYYSSFTIVVGVNEIRLLFNDRVRGAGGVVEYTLNTKGELNNKMLFGNQGPYVAIAPLEAKQLDARSMLIPTAKDRKFAFVKLIY
ncbi:MAG: hypothetical protein EP332_12290 [Bacteroidetes bacterium]|nr:MAG: hypothetical protein EP332_12290 [Bacteroidota bacterium]